MVKNRIGNVLRVLGIVIFVVGFIAGLMFGSLNSVAYEPFLPYGSTPGFSWSIALVIWAQSFVVSILIIGFSEVIFLLQDLLNQSKKVEM